MYKMVLLFFIRFLFYFRHVTDEVLSLVPLSLIIFRNILLVVKEHDALNLFSNGSEKCFTEKKYIYNDITMHAWACPCVSKEKEKKG